MDTELLVKLVTKVVIELLNTRNMNFVLKEDSWTASPETSGTLPGKRVICMEDLEAMQPGILMVDRNTIITPLAKDYAKEKKIEIKFRE